MILVVGVVSVTGVSGEGESCDVHVDRNIQDALNGSAAGDTICVEGGTYEEELTIQTNDISLVAENPDDPPVLDGSSFGDDSVGIDVSETTGVTVEGFEVRSFGSHGIHVHEGHEFEVTESRLLENGDTGILLNGTEAATVRANNASNNGWNDEVPGIRLYESPNALIEDNTANSNGRQGINLWEHSDGATVRNNTANGNDYSGIYVQDASDGFIENNTAIGNGLRAIHLEAANETSIANFTIRENEARGNSQSGILIQAAHDVSIEDNDVQSNVGASAFEIDEAHGIYVLDSENVTVRSNQVENSHRIALASRHDDAGDGIKLERSDGAVVEANDIVDNVGDGIVTEDSTAPTISGNVVTTGYSGQSSDGIIVADSPHAMVDGNVVDAHDVALVAGSNYTIVQANDFSDNGLGIQATGIDVGLTVRDNDVISNARDNVWHGGLTIREVDDVLVENNTIEGNSGGLRIRNGGTNVSVVNNEISNNEDTDPQTAYGVYLSELEDVTISGNHVSGNDGDGIVLEAVVEVTVEDNAVEHNEADLVLEEVVDATVLDNAFESGLVLSEPETLDFQYADHTVENNLVGGDPLYYSVGDDGIVLDDEYGQIVLVGAQDIAVENQRVHDVTVAVQVVESDGISVADVRTYYSQYGVLATNATGLTIDAGSFAAGDRGVSLYGDVTGTTVTNSSMTDNGLGLFVGGDADDVTVNETSFSGNDLGLEYAPTDPEHELSATGNWWGHESGPSGGVEDPNADATADGSGDEIDVSSSAAVAFTPWTDAATGTYYGIELDVFTPLYGVEGDVLDVNVTVTNHGEAGMQTLQTVDSSGEVLAEKQVSLDAGETRDVTMVWETGIGDAAVDTIYVLSEDDADIGDWLWLEPAAPNFNVAVTDTNAPVFTGEDLELTVTVENLGLETDEQSIELRNDGGDVLDAETVELTGSNDQQLTLVWSTDAGDVGEHDLFVHSEDDDVTETVVVSDPDTDPADTGTITGIVTNQTGGDAIEGVTVTIVDEDGEIANQTATDAAGLYAVDVEPGTHEVQFEADGYFDDTVSDRLVEVDETTTVDGALEPELGFGSIEGTVTNATDGQGIYAWARLIDTNGLLGDEGDVYPIHTTIPSGAYNHPFLEPGTYDVEFQADGYEAELVEGVEVQPNEATTLDSALTPAGDIRVVDATVDQSNVLEGNSVTVTAIIENDGDDADEYTAALEIDQVGVDEETVSVDPDGVAMVEFEHTFDETGTYIVTVDGLDAGIVTVDEEYAEPTTVSITGVEGTTTDGDTVYANDDLEVTLEVTNDSAIDGVAVGIDAIDTSYVVTENASNVDGSEWSGTIDLENVPDDGSYRLFAVVVDDAGISNHTLAAETVAVDREQPSLSAAITDVDGNEGTIEVRSDTELTDSPEITVSKPDGSNETLAQLTSSTQQWTTELIFDDSGEYTVETNGTDHAGNEGVASTSVFVDTDFTISDGVGTLHNEDTGTFIEFNSSEDSLEELFAVLSENTDAFEELDADQIGAGFLTATLDETLDENLSSATIHVPADVTTIDGIDDPEDVTLQRYDESTSTWDSVNTTVETIAENDTDLDITGTYWVAEVDGFSTYGAIASDDEPPTITDATPTDGEMLSDGTSNVAVSVEYEDDASGVDVSTVELVINGDDVTGDAATSITSSETTHTVDVDAGESYTIDLTIADNAGNEETYTHTFAIDDPGSGTSSSSSSSSSPSVSPTPEEPADDEPESEPDESAADDEPDPDSTDDETTDGAVDGDEVQSSTDDETTDSTADGDGVQSPTTDDDTPGFGPGIALIALLAMMGYLTRRE